LIAMIYQLKIKMIMTIKNLSLKKKEL